jgi:hypothetical protein
MVVEATADVALAAVDAGDVLLQIDGGYSAGSFGDVTDALSNPEIWLGAIAGGAFGAALGALPAFVFTGFLVIAGVLGGGGQGVGIGFGPIFGPHISFAGGAAAVAYAASRGKVGSGFDYHNAKDITVALGSKPDIMAVGSGFAIMGLAIEQLSRQMALPVDPIPLSICISAIVHRAVFGYSVVGVVSDKAGGFFDMGPFEREETRAPGEVVADGGMEGEDRLAVEPWLPEMYKWGDVAAIGFFSGLAAAVMAHYLLGAGLGINAAFGGFGFSAASLIFLNLGLGKIPVTHHMTLPAATAFMAVNENAISQITAISDPALSLGTAPALLVGAAFGVYGAIMGEVGQRIFYAHSDTHFDPPAISIVITTLTIGLLVVAGVFPWGTWIPGTL